MRANLLLAVKLGSRYFELRGDRRKKRCSVDGMAILRRRFILGVETAPKGRYQGSRNLALIKIQS